MRLEFVLGFCTGVGASFEEAEAALRQAKQRKLVASPEQAPEEFVTAIKQSYEASALPINYYNNEPLRNDGDGPSFADRLASHATDVRESLTRLEKIEQMYGPESLAYTSLLEEIRGRGKTGNGAVNGFGYAYKELTDDTSGLGDPLFVLLDGDGMKYWNEAQGAGYEAVTEHLHAIERALVQSLRTQPAEPEEERRNPPTGDFDIVLPHGIVSRTHGDAGDEFLLKVWASQENFRESIFPRIVKNVYKQQLELYSSQ